MDKQTVRLIFIHLLMFSVFWTGTSGAALAVTLFFFIWRGLGLTIAYHRYFTHRSFKTSRVFQFFLAFAGSMCMQRGALWWAANHRRHHQYSDTENDPHSPVTGSFWHAHMGWALEEKAFETDYSRVRDFDAFPELRWLNEHSDLVHGFYAAFLFILGEGLKIFKPELSTSGLQFLVWGYLIGGIAHLHTIFLINSWAHIFGSRPYPFPAREGRDNSHNVGWLALITFGEGWHYNHHCFPMSARIGLAWWEIDFGWWVIKFLEKLGIVWDVKTAKRPKSH